jgi:hypothetical protein
LRALSCCCAGSFQKLRQKARVALKRYFIHRPDTPHSVRYPDPAAGLRPHRPYLV